jgi:hypothetical protein
MKQDISCLLGIADVLLSGILQAHTFISNTLRYLSRLQEIRLQLLSSPMYSDPSNSNNVPVDASRTLKSLTKFIRAIGKFYENMMHIDPKAFAAIEGTVNAVGWWWGEVATAVQRGEMPQDGMSRRLLKIEPLI